MEVLLHKDVEKLGKAGDVVEVAPGYARNYLFPRRIASVVTKENLMRLEFEKRRARREAQRRREALLKLAQRLQSASATIPAQASDSGTLFGSVAEPQIAAALREEGYDVQPEAIRLGKHIKETGVYAVDIELAPEITATVRVWVVAD